MKKIILLFLIICPLSSKAFIGHDQGGGGDPCEDRIKSIRTDLQSWIKNNGAAQLKLPKEITAALYSQEMLQQMEASKIRCVSEEDPGFPVEVDGTAKVCRFDKSSVESKITCDFVKFLNLSESDQYMLVHHEFAGLAGFEMPTGDDSQYEISNQISKSLQSVIVKKIAIKQTPLPFCIHRKPADENTVGYTCQTNMNWPMTRVDSSLGIAWKSPDGLIWSRDFGVGTYAKSSAYCKALGARLPNDNDLSKMISIMIAMETGMLVPDSIWIEDRPGEYSAPGWHNIFLAGRNIVDAGNEQHEMYGTICVTQ